MCHKEQEYAKGLVCLLLALSNQFGCSGMMVCCTYRIYCMTKNAAQQLFVCVLSLNKRNSCWSRGSSSEQSGLTSTSIKQWRWLRRLIGTPPCGGVFGQVWLRRSTWQTRKPAGRITHPSWPRNTSASPPRGAGGCGWSCSAQSAAPAKVRPGWAANSEQIDGLLPCTTNELDFFFFFSVCVCWHDVLLTRTVKIRDTIVLCNATVTNS